MKVTGKKEKLIGLLFIISMITGIGSVAPSVDGSNYLTEASIHSNQVILAAISQFIMAMAYMAIGILFFPIIKRFGTHLSIGFLSSRIIASTLVIIGTIILISLLALSQTYEKIAPNNSLDIEVIGNMLKITRDYINHVFMILVLCLGNILLYLLLIRSKLIPSWLSIWGLFGALLSIIASVLVLFQVLDIITTNYILLNVPTGIQELVLGLWLIFKGVNHHPFTTKTE